MASVDPVAAQVLQRELPRSNGVRELARFGRDPLAYLDGLRGDPRELVPFTLGRLRCRLVAAPELVHEVLASEDWPPISRGRLQALDRWYGGGLILTEGAEHHRQRDHLWQPLVAGAEERGAALAVERAAAVAGGWRDGEAVEIFRALRALLLSIDWLTLTGEEMSPALVEAQLRGTAAASWLLGPFGETLWRLPLPASARARAARRRLDRALGALVRERRAAGGEDGLAELARREDDDALVGATVKQWLGAHQSHAWLTWTLYLLAAQPELRAHWYEELDRVLGPRAATAGDLGSLPLTRRLLKESLRLYPPIWGFFRQLTADYRVGGETLPAGTLLALSQWFAHRDERSWPEPLRFDPERFGDGADPPRPGSYFPFSSGPYGCPAPQHATTVASLVLVTIGQRWSLELTSPSVRPVATGVVEPKGGLKLVPRPR
jgi:cytochrome P450